MAAQLEDTVLLECSESILICQICMERFESPRILPCQHIFCKECTISLVMKHCFDSSGSFSGPQFPCPNCRKSCKIRCKSVEKARLLEAFPEHLLMKTLLEASEIKAKQNTDTDDKNGIALSEKKASQIQDSLRRYRHMLISMRHFLLKWPSKEPRFCHPVTVSYCTDMREKVSNFMLELTKTPGLRFLPKLGRNSRTISNLLTSVTEEERVVSNTFSLDTMRNVVREVSETPCCIEWIPMYRTMQEIERATQHCQHSHQPHTDSAPTFEPNDTPNPDQWSTSDTWDHSNDSNDQGRQLVIRVKQSIRLIFYFFVTVALLYGVTVMGNVCEMLLTFIASVFHLMCALVTSGV